MPPDTRDQWLCLPDGRRILLSVDVGKKEPLKLRLFPLKKNGKLPAIEGGFKAATDDAPTIEAWFSDRYKNHNVGVATGQGLLVLDADCNGRPGLDSLDLMDDLYDLPASLRVRTPSGGVHVYLNSPENALIPCSADRLEGFPGIDVRGDGGYVVGPGSIIDGKTYEIDTEGASRT